jgi:site-specific DNA-methyltransferase (adenine-specific)
MKVHRTISSIVEENSLILGDCLEVLKNIPDNFVDSIICDPPYGTTSLSWDSVIPLDQLWTELKRVRKPYAPIVMFGSQPFTTVLINSNIEEFKYCLVWEKSKAANFQQAPNMPLKKHEDIVVFSDGVVGHKAQTNRRMTYNPQGIIEVDKFVKRDKIEDPHGYYRENGIYKGYTQNVSNYPSSVLKFGNMHNPSHPTQKPLELMEWLVNTYSNENEVVLDFTMGNGTTCMAALQTGRKFIGIEKKLQYFDHATKWIQEQSQILENFDME